MKTKFVLHGGFASGKKQQDDAFFLEMLKDAPHDAKILLVYFAEPEEKVAMRTEQDKEEFNANKGSKELRFKVATEAAFKEDCAWADVVYLHGGKTARLMEALVKYPDVGEILSKRTIAGDSAGAHVLGRLFYGKNSKTIGKGSGILPMKITAHYEIGLPDPFSNIEPAIENLLLSEYETKVIWYNDTHE